MAFEVTSFFFEEEYSESISERFIKIRDYYQIRRANRKCPKERV